MVRPYIINYLIVLLKIDLVKISVVRNKHGLVAFELDVSVPLHTCAGRDKLTDDNVLFKTYK